MKLQNLDEIFTERVLRIPDYQRGYAWNLGHVGDFWNDIEQLDIQKNHYTGVITLEPFKGDNFSRWELDGRIIKEKGYKRFYVVDGQQRLTTAMIMLQAIIEKTSEFKEFLDGVSIYDIKSKYILCQIDESIKKNFLFGYEVDDPSNEFLKVHIFEEDSSGYSNKETLYTRNLASSKGFFTERLKNMEIEEVEELFCKLTKKLKFNIYEIEEELDVFVMFETMNSRGKSLTSLELLKNRLIYLSTLLKDKVSGEELRKIINDSWKTIYEFLGKNPDEPLDEDDFLKNHWIMYFKYSRDRGDDYIKFLLGEFISGKIIESKNEKDEIEAISNYVKSLQKSVVFWHYIHDPSNSNLFDSNSEEVKNNKNLLDKMKRLGFKAFRPLLLSCYILKRDFSEINSLLTTAEKFIFILFFISRKKSDTRNSEIYRYAKAMLDGTMLDDGINISKIILRLEYLISEYRDFDAFSRYISEKYKIRSKGFYDWKGLPYFLFEHECWLKDRGKKSIKEISWEGLLADKKDSATIEHIYPQTDTDPYWQERFAKFSDEERLYLLHSLGNLLPLSASKNSIMQNYDFETKKNNGEGVGYYNGSVSENEVALYEEWTPQSIKKRGLELLEFMKERWGIEFESEEFKIKLLHLDFLDKKEEEPAEE